MGHIGGMGGLGGRRDDRDGDRVVNINVNNSLDVKAITDRLDAQDKKLTAILAALEASPEMAAAIKRAQDEGAKLAEVATKVEELGQK